MRISCREWNETKSMHARSILMRPIHEARRAEWIGQQSKFTASASILSHFSSKMECKFINLIHTRQKKQFCTFCKKKSSLDKTSQIKIKQITPEENNETTVRAKRRSHSALRSTQSALWIFNPLRVLWILAFWLARFDAECMNIA